MKICTIAFKSIHTKRYLQWLVDHNHDVYWITNEAEGIKGVRIIDLNNIKTYCSFSKKIWRLERKIKQLLYIKNILGQIKPEVFHLHTLYYPAFLGAIINYRPLVISPWDGDVLWTNKRPFYYKLFVKHCLDKADMLTADNEIMKKGLLGYGVNAKKINIIRWFGVDTKLFKPMQKDNRLLEELSIKDGLVVLSMRSLGKGYNIDKIIKSIPLILKKFKDITYIFAWYSGGLEKELRLLVEDLQIENKVRFVGRIPYEDIPKYYSISDVAISIASPDSTPATMLESMASGVPMVVSREASITEFIKDDINGKVVDPHNINQIAEKTVELLLDAEKRKEYGRRSRELVEKIGNIDVEMNKVEDIYKDLIAKFSR